MKKLLFITLCQLILVLPKGLSINPILVETEEKTHIFDKSVTNYNDGVSLFQKVKTYLLQKVKLLKKAIFDDSIQVAFILLIISLVSVAGLFLFGTSALSATFLALLLISVICFVGSLIAFMYHFFS